ncbi:alpha/beta fold hydrolase [Bradyrhizobium sp. HKCCYLS2038]|uniref:alpha/beta fold hydrolase n=1 Tax=unclassified Bradyrhizobium TaxID=2631580 RepID=UPI003EBDA373
MSKLYSFPGIPKTASSVRSAKSSLTFDDLSKVASSVAKLVSQGNKSEQVVCAVITRTRSPETIGVIAGIIQSGALYVPLDPQIPAEQFESCIELATPSYIFVDEVYPSLVQFVDRVIIIGDLDIASHDGEMPRSEYRDARYPAYLLFTSGSTGAPKGVLGTLGGLVERINWGRALFSSSSTDVFCQRTPLTFVDSLAEIFVPLATGADLVICEHEVVRDPSRFLKYIAEHKITRLTLVPAMLSSLLREERFSELFSTVRGCISSGDVLPVELARQFLALAPNCRLINLYGSTECAGDATWHEATDHDLDGASLPIGRPLPNIEVRIVDPLGKPVAHGAVGEILVLSDTAVALGYRSRDEADQHSFISTEDGENRSAHGFRTGDLGMYRDGNLYFVGRDDGLFKINGQKASHRAFEQLTDLGVVCRVAIAGRSKLVLVAENQGADERSVLERARQAVLRANRIVSPLFIPKLISIVSDIPRTTSGKYDRKLLEHDAFLIIRSIVDNGGQPFDEIEATVLRIVRDCLGLVSLGADTDLLDAGLDSLDAVSLAASLEEFFSTKLELGSVFSSNTPRELARLVRMEEPEKANVIQVCAGGKGIPLVCVPPGLGLGFAFRTFRPRIKDHPVYALNSRAFGESKKPYDSVEGLARLHLHTIAEIGLKGPICLVGQSFGGEVAFEMARLFLESGLNLHALVLLDTARTNTPTADSHPDARKRYFLRVGIDPNSFFACQLVDEMNCHDAISLRFRPKPLDFDRIFLLKASESTSADPFNGWLEYCPRGLRVIPVIGEHDHLLDEWYVDSIVSGLSRALASSWLG